MRGFATTSHPKAAACLYAASNMHDGRWMFTRKVDPATHNGNQVVIIGVRECEAYDAVQTVEWLEERERGYPGLRKFEGGANWPAVEDVRNMHAVDAALSVASHHGRS